MTISIISVYVLHNFKIRYWSFHIVTLNSLSVLNKLYARLKQFKTNVKPKSMLRSIQHQTFTTVSLKKLQWSVPQLSIMIIYNSTLSILIQWIGDILSGLVYTIKSYFMFVINLITWTMDFSELFNVGGDF